jgi:hypothetical protein
MLINVSTRKFRRSVRLPTGDVGSVPGDGTSKSAVSRKLVALSSAKLRQWLAFDLSALDLLAIQIDGLHISDEVILVAAIGIDGRGEKHPLGLVEGATENAATVQALLDNLVARGLDPAGVWLFIIDGAKALDGRRHDGGQEGLPAAESLQAVTKVRDALLALRAARADPALPISARPGHLLVPVYGSARRSQKEPPTSWSTVA